MPRAGAHNHKEPQANTARDLSFGDSVSWFGVGRSFLQRFGSLKEWHRIGSSQRWKSGDGFNCA